MVIDRFLPFLGTLTVFAGLAIAAGPAQVRAQDADPADEAQDEPEVSPVPPQRVYLLAVPMEDDLEAVAARVGAAARASLRRIEGVRWEAPDQAYLGYTDHMLERLRRARERLVEGRQAYLNLELEQAIELLSGAVDDFDSAGGAMEDPQDLGEALLFLGASQTFAGQARAARNTFQRLHIQMPHITPDPNTFNPEVVQRYEQAAPRDRRDPSGTITIDSEPPGAVAYVDFVPRGRTPLTVEGLLGGEHTVRVTRPGATPFVQQVSLRRGGSDQVNAFLEDNEATEGLADTVQDLGTADVGSLSGPIADIAMALELDKIGIIRVSSSEQEGRAHLELLVYDVSDGARILRMHGPAPTALGALESSVRRLVSGGLDAALRPRAEGGQIGDVETIPAFQSETGPASQDEDAGGESLFGEWWFWAGVGGAVALGVILTIALSSGGGDLGENTGGQVILEF